MKFQGNNQGALQQELVDALQEQKTRRAFNAEAYVTEKVNVINEYFKYYGLDTAIVGVSGGVDSALVLGLLAKANALTGTSVKRIIPLLLPALGTDVGASNQDDATSRGEDLCRHYGLTPLTFTALSSATSVVAEEMERLMKYPRGDWGRGQLVAYQRTPALYYATTLSTENGHPAIVVGTTNFDEGGYLGYIGKASDGMVDVQAISDLHKSEVFAAAKEVGVIDSILQATPSGDMYDGRVDEEVFGTTYDFVELFLSVKMMNDEAREAFFATLSAPALEQYQESAANLEALHKYNRHKYLGRSPAVHLDIMPCKIIDDGWNNPSWAKGEVR